MKDKREFDFFIKEINEKSYEECKNLIVFWLWDWIKAYSNTLAFQRISCKEELEKLLDEINIIPREYYDSMQYLVKEFPANYNNDVLISLVLAKLHELKSTPTRVEENAVSVWDEEMFVPQITILEDNFLSTMSLEEQSAMEEMLICNYMLRCVMEEKAVDYVEWRSECSRCFSGIKDTLSKINVRERNVTERLVERYNFGDKAYQAIFSLWQEKNNHYVTYDGFVELKLALMSCIASAPFSCIKEADLKKRTVYEKVPRFFKKYRIVLESLLDQSEKSDVYKNLTRYLGELVTAEAFVFKAAALITSMAEPHDHMRIIKVFSKLYRLPGIKLRNYYCDRLFELYVEKKRNFSVWELHANRMIEVALKEVDMANNILYVLSNGLLEYCVYYNYYISEILDIEKVPMDSKNEEYVVDHIKQQTKYTITEEEVTQKEECWKEKIGIEEYNKTKEFIRENLVESNRKALKELFEVFDPDLKYMPQGYSIVKKNDRGLYEGILPARVQWTKQEKWCVAALYAEIKKILEGQNNMCGGENKYSNQKEGNYGEETFFGLLFPGAVVLKEWKESMEITLEKYKNQEHCKDWLEFYDRIIKCSRESLIRYIVWVDGDKIPGADYSPDVRYFTDFIRKERLGPALQEVFLYGYGMDKKRESNTKSNILLHEKLPQYLERRRYDLPGSKEITRTQVWNQNLDFYEKNSWFNKEFPIKKDKTVAVDGFMEELKVALLVSVMDFPLKRNEESVKDIETLQSCIKDYYGLLKPLEKKKDFVYENLLMYTGALIEAGAFVEKAADFLVGYVPRENDEFSKLYYWCISQIYALPGIKLREVVLNKVIDIIKNHERNSMYAYECKAYIEKYIGQIRNIIVTMIGIARNIDDDRYDELLFQKIKESLIVTLKQGDAIKKTWIPKKEEIVFSLYKEINVSLMNGEISVNTLLI